MGSGKARCICLLGARLGIQRKRTWVQVNHNRSSGETEEFLIIDAFWHRRLGKWVGRGGQQVKWYASCLYSGGKERMLLVRASSPSCTCILFHFLT
jgi:hypothetical protein